jgi:hypothetical protein
MADDCRYPVLERAREIAQDAELDILEVRKYLGVPLAGDIRQWMSIQPSFTKLVLDFAGVRAVTASVAEETGPLLMQAVQQTPGLEHKYPVYCFDRAEHAYTFAVAFSNLNWTGLAVVQEAIEPASSVMTVARDGDAQIVVLGQLSRQMERILALASDSASAGKDLTSEDLLQLDFLSGVTPAARSKRLTELYARRLLAFRENLSNPKERLFKPAWAL